MEALNSYFLEYCSYPKADPPEKLTQTGAASTNLYQEMHKNTWIYGFDPWDFILLDGEYFGYWSSGQKYELTAVLSNFSYLECLMEGGYCVYKIRDGEVVSTKGE